MVKLMSYLITLNISVFIGNIIVAIPIVIRKSEINIAGLAIAVQLGYFFSLSSSTIVTPLVMIIVLKPLRKRTKKIFLRLCCRDFQEPDKNISFPTNTQGL